MSLSRSTRFEVFKRDKFACQYCGRRAPDVVLHVDHINPRANGGKDDLLNLLTACAECNGGKGARLLSDDQRMSKHMNALLELADRREQLEMLATWQSVLLDTSQTELEILRSAYRVAFPGWELNRRGQADARRLVRRYGLREFLDALHRAACEAVVLDEHGEATDESIRDAWDRCGKHLHWTRLCERDPGRAQLLYARGILRRRVPWVNNGEALRILTEAADKFVPWDELRRAALTARTWTDWKDIMSSLIEQAKAGCS